MATSSVKTVSTAIDDLPCGSPEPEDLHGPVRRYPLPEGITEGRLLRDITLIALPSLVELVLTQLTSMADQIMVGRLPGEEGITALAAVGLAAQPKFLLMTMIQALNIGATALIARFRGQQDRLKANRVFKQAMVLNFIISFLFMLLGLGAARPLILFMSGGSGQISGATVDAGVTYLVIQMYGFIPLCAGFTVTAALRGIGETRIPLFYNTAANVINLFLNYVMIYGHLGCPKMGVAGAAIATVIGQTAAFLMAMLTVLGGRRYIHLDFRDRFSFDWPLIRSLAEIGVPSMVEQLFMRAGIIIYTRTVAGLGDLMYATHQVLMSIQAMTFMMGQAFASSATTLMGQSIGKGRFDMAVIYMRRTRNLGMSISAVMAVLIIIFRRQLIGLYNETPEVIALGADILFLLAFSQPFQTDQFITSGGLRGAGDTRYTALVIAVTVLGVRSGLGLLTVRVLDWSLWGAWIALLADQMLRTVLMILRYNSGKWKSIATARFAGADEA
ncbi:MAG: MATE family efflux transporter [Oscillospiraceae bacterium]|nr:MATE family efflux transporter [Oscillospiraceae bacterium]